MKINKGFTLIELLAVIVILAIIALIASPIIIGLIEDARKEAAANSAYGVFHSVENVYAKVLLTNGNGLPDYIVYNFQSNGTIETLYGASAVITVPAGWGIVNADAALTFNGTKPTGGSIRLNKDGSVTVVTALQVNGFTCAKSGDEFTCS
ncbi:MAG: prepilin-type N-terminal cleavage/methylation domain-containing protein [Ignavibacteriales bacterium]